MTLFYLVRKFLLRIGHQLQKDKVSVFAAQAAFFIVISAIPFLMLILALLQYFVPVTQSQLTRWALAFLPSMLHSRLVQLIDELYSQTTLSLISATAVSALWAASRSIFALAGGLREIYGTRETRGYFRQRIIALFHTLIFLALLIFSLLLLVFGNTIQQLLEQYIPFLAEISSYIISVRTLLALVLLSLVFALMYQILPDRRSRFLCQLPGAVFSSLGWMIFSLSFSLYIEHFSGFSTLYGSLTTLVFLMLWLYFCMIIFLTGAELNVQLQSWESEE